MKNLSPLWAVMVAVMALTLACSESGSQMDAEPFNGARPDGTVPTPDAGPEPELTPEQKAVLSVEETLKRPLTGLSAPVHVVRTEFNIPHVFAANRNDMALVHGYLVASDRYWMMELGRRLGRGESPKSSGVPHWPPTFIAGQGLPYVGQRLYDNFTPERRAEVDHFAKGINLYIAEVARGMHLHRRKSICFTACSGLIHPQS